jgi:hypothetical protein
MGMDMGTAEVTQHMAMESAPVATVNTALAASAVGTLAAPAAAVAVAVTAAVDRFA